MKKTYFIKSDFVETFAAFTSFAEVWCKIYVTTCDGERFSKRFT